MKAILRTERELETREYLRNPPSPFQGEPIVLKHAVDNEGNSSCEIASHPPGVKAYKGD